MRRWILQTVPGTFFSFYLRLWQLSLTAHGLLVLRDIELAVHFISTKTSLTTGGWKTVDDGESSAV